MSCGRYPAKAVIGEHIPIRATVWREGHDAVGAAEGNGTARGGGGGGKWGGNQNFQPAPKHPPQPAPPKEVVHYGDLPDPARFNDQAALDLLAAPWNTASMLFPSGSSTNAA